MLNLMKSSKSVYCLFYLLLSKNQKLLNILRPISVFSNVRFQRTFPSLQSSDVMIKNNSINLINLRHKSKKQQNLVYDEDSDEGSDENENAEDEMIEGKGVVLKTYNFESLRVGTVLKKAFGFTRKFVDESFFGKKIRVNGQILLKKGTHVKAGDEIDLVRGSASTNPNFLNVARIEILKINLDSENNSFLVKLRKTKFMIIEKYGDMGNS